MANGGRPTKLTQEVADGIIRLIEHAVPPATAARSNGVGEATFHEWIRRGEGRDDRHVEEIYIEFAARVRAAEAMAEAALSALAVAKIRTTADAILILERRFGARWRPSRNSAFAGHVIKAYAAARGLDPGDVMWEAEAVIADLYEQGSDPGRFSG
jgi:hypothetical protein